MPKPNKLTSGFSLPEVMIIIVVALLVAIAGRIVYDHFDQSNTSIILKRQQQVDKYISHLNVDNYTDFGRSLYSNGYLTSSLYATTQSLTNSYASSSFSSNPSYASVVCVDYIPNAFTYGKVSINSANTEATLTVKVSTLDSLDTASYTAYWLNNNGTWLLNKVSC